MSKYPENDPNGLGGLPIGLQVSSQLCTSRTRAIQRLSHHADAVASQEYIAPYPGSNGDILLLGMPIAKVSECLHGSAQPGGESSSSHRRGDRGALQELQLMGFCYTDLSQRPPT